MASPVSSEKPKGVTVREIAAAMRRTRESGEKILARAGPAVVHTGSVEHICQFDSDGVLERTFLPATPWGRMTSNRRSMGPASGISVGNAACRAEEGHEHHLRAINTIRRLGGIRAAVAKGVLRSGIMYECVRHNIPSCWPGAFVTMDLCRRSLTDTLVAQQRMRESIHGVGFCLMVATALHAIATGNLLPAWVKVACVISIRRR